MAKKGKDIAFLDTETTGLVEAIGADLVHQPHIIEICIIKTNKNLTKTRVLDTLVKPPVPIEPFITRITGITNEMVENSPTFPEIFKQVKSILKNIDRLVAQNLRFDKDMVEIECSRINKTSPINNIPDLFCTVEQSMHFKGMRMNSKELYATAGHGEIQGIHRAKADVKAMIEYYKFIAAKELPKHLRKGAKHATK